MFSTQSDDCTPFVNIFDIISLFAAELKEPKIGIWGKGLIYPGGELVELQTFAKVQDWKQINGF